MHGKDFFSPVAAVKVFLFNHPQPLPLKKCPHWPRFCVVIYANISKTFPNIVQKISKHSPKYLHPLSKNAVQELHRIRKHFHGVNLANQKTWPIKPHFFLYFHNFHACFLFSLRETVAFHISLLSREFCFLRFLFPVRAL